MTKVLINLTCFFACAFLGASMVLFTGWPLALVSAGLVFLGIQQVNAALTRRTDKRAYAKEFSKLHSAAMEFQTQLNDTRDRIAALDLAMEERSNAQGRKIVAELKVLESLMREFAGKISRSATPICGAETYTPGLASCSYPRSSTSLTTPTIVNQGSSGANRIRWPSALWLGRNCRASVSFTTAARGAANVSRSSSRRPSAATIPSVRM